MTLAQELYGFFNSAEDDARSYEADDLATAFRAVCGSGVSNLADCLKVTAEGGTLRTKVAPGRALVQGYFYELRDDGGAQTAFTHTAASGNDRIDRVVVRLDLTARTVGVVKKEGAPGASPAAPALTRTAAAYELALASVRVRAGATAIAAEDVTDERGNESLCGEALPEALKLSGLWDKLQKPNATAQTPGLMSAADKAKLDNMSGEALGMSGSDERTVAEAIGAAQTAAETAQASAETAQTAAETAQSTAEDAQASASTAQSAHNTLVGAISTGAYLQLQTGVCTFTNALPNNALNKQTLTFPVAYAEPPRVMLTLYCTSCHMFFVSASAVTATGFSLCLRNAYTSAKSPKVFWTAIGKLNTSVTVDDALIADAVSGDVTGGDDA